MENSKKHTISMKRIGKGNHGNAYLLQNGCVQKETNDILEFYAAKELIGKVMKHIIVVYQCHKVLLKNGVVYYKIKEEYLQMSFNRIGIKRKNAFVKYFKLSWADCHEELPFDSYLRSINYIDFMFSCINNQCQEYCQRAFKLFLKRTRSKRFVGMYDMTCCAIAELHRYCPYLELDLNGGNLGFDSKGQLKFFDLRYKT